MMQNGKTEHIILCMNEDDVNITFKPDTPSDQNRLVCESLKSKTAELSTLFLCCWNDPCWLYIRWTIFILIWIVNNDLDNPGTLSFHTLNSTHTSPLSVI